MQHGHYIIRNQDRVLEKQIKVCLKYFVVFMLSTFKYFCRLTCLFEGYLLSAGCTL